MSSMRYSLIELMSEEVDLGGIKVAAKDWEATPESIKLVFRFLLEERNQMKLKIKCKVLRFKGSKTLHSIARFR